MEELVREKLEGKGRKWKQREGKTEGRRKRWKGKRKRKEVDGEVEGEKVETSKRKKRTGE